jgi:hypothetical protein
MYAGVNTGCAKQHQKPAATHLGSRSSPVEHNNAAKDAVLGPVSDHVGHAVRILLVVQVSHVIEQRCPGLDGLETTRAVWPEELRVPPPDDLVDVAGMEFGFSPEEKDGDLVYGARHKLDQAQLGLPGTDFSVLVGLHDLGRRLAKAFMRRGRWRRNVTPMSRIQEFGDRRHPGTCWFVR